MRIIEPANGVGGELSLPSDKSISHRLLIFSAISKNPSKIIIHNIGEDVKTTQNVLLSLGINIGRSGEEFIIYPDKFSSPLIPINMGNSGTTTRLMTGLLSAIPGFFISLYGDESLSWRPMKRIILPLKNAGAHICGRDNNYLPLFIEGKDLKPINFKLKIASAQVKSALILSALNINGISKIEEPLPSRDHTERFLSYMGAHVYKRDDTIFVDHSQPDGIEYDIPGDFSQAAFFITLGLLLKKSDLIIKNLNLNPTRIGFLNKLIEMGANIEIDYKTEDPEPIGDLRVRYTSYLKGVKITKDDIPLLIDEIPLFAILGTFSDSETVIEGAEELRVKESDRIKVTVEEFSKLGIDIQELPDGFKVKPSSIKGGVTVYAHKDHRIAMALTIAGLLSSESVILEGEEAVNISYPGFFKDVSSILL